MSMLAGILACTPACDPGAEERARAVRDAIIAATEERAAEAIKAAEAEARHTALAAERERQNAIARREAHRYAEAIMVLAVADAAEFSARRKRVVVGLQRLRDALPEPDLNAEWKCERYNYPCSVLDVPSEILQRSNDLSEEVDLRIRRGDDFDEVLEWLLMQKDIIDIREQRTGIDFQVRGDMPTRVRFTRFGAGRADPQ